MADASAIDANTLTSLCQRVRDHGFALYQWGDSPGTASAREITDNVTRLHTALNLHAFDDGVVHDEHGLSLLTDLTGSDQGRFIPYTPRAMGWHTDGYYNARQKSLRCFTLHCIQNAADGGALTLLDDQRVLIALYDHNPQMVSLLSHPQAMTLPANSDTLGHDRPDVHSAVFFARDDGTLATHFTTRTRNIAWRNAETETAARQMKQLIDELTDWHHKVRLEPGQGIITRNILHRRDAYTDATDQPRKMLRGRYVQTPRYPNEHQHGS
jgi:hypothetical protein